MRTLLQPRKTSIIYPTGPHSKLGTGRDSHVRLGNVAIAAATASILVWTYCLSDLNPDDFSLLEELLDQDEAARLASIGSTSFRHAYIAAHGLQRLQLSHDMTNRQPNGWRFKRHPHGKSAVLGADRTDVNLSHTRGYVTCVLARDAIVGIDAESIQGTPPLEVADQVLTRNELAWLWARPSELIGRTFFQLWTIKEAVLKATGTGFLSSPLSFQVDVASGQILFHDKGSEESKKWHFLQWSEGNSCAYAVAWRSEHSISRVDIVRQPVWRTVAKLHPLQEQ